MNSHILLAHPEPKSFNGHLAELSRETMSAAGGNHTLSDLYTMDFDPREGPWHYPQRADDTVFHAQSEQRASAEHGRIPEDVSEEIQRLLACDLLIVHFPLWWFGPPAILKGWMDRVFVYGHLYRSTMRYDTGIAVGKKVLACVTTGSSAENCAPNGREGDTRLHLWPILYPFRYLGFDVLQPHIIHGVGSTAFMEGHEDGLSGLELHSRRWVDVLHTVSDRPSIPYNADTDFDKTKRLKPGAPEYSPFIQHEKGSS